MIMEKTIDNLKSETFYLWWFDATKGTRKPAGVAFFDNNFGDYRFKLDFLPENQYYLRCIGGSTERVEYRLEAIHKNKEGKFLRRVPIGEGSSMPNGDVRITVFPLDKELILVLSDEREAVAECAFTKAS